MRFNRIHITGNAGSGKSTLAAKLANRTGLPLYGLDKVVWQSGWRKTPLDERREAESKLIEKPEWIIEGVSSSVRSAADLVVYLDRSRAACLLRCVKRNTPYLFRSRPELPQGCPEIRAIPMLVRIIWNFPNLVGRGILKDSRLATEPRQFVRLVNDNEAAGFLENFPCREE